MIERRVIAVEGVVQGVGFRPYVHRLAATHALRGFVRNDAQGVTIDVEGELAQLDQFCRSLGPAAPVLARIDRVQVQHGTPQEYTAFHIVASRDAVAEDRTAQLPTDVATCDACLAELFDATSRRFGHAFITCTDCGPRFTVVEAMPFDRTRTTMAAFPLCGRCESEYEDETDRRFHAETIACPDCGPVLVAREASAGALCATRSDAIDAAIAAIADGRIVAIKSLGGFQLACDATNEAAVARLRSRKHRPGKPFAIMLADADVAARVAAIDPAERLALTSPARPVVLLTRADDADGPRIARSVAPGSAFLGVMLPSTPIHHLLLASLDRPLVMTSGNRGGDPVATGDDDARAVLAGIADLFLTHDRTIAARCDDSVARLIAGSPRVLRRARGWVPETITTPCTAPGTVLAVGGHLKSTVCVMRGGAAHLSAHIGDLDSAASRDALRETVEATLRLAGQRPLVIAHDLHPEYASTRFAETYSVAHGIGQRVAVQHHHAHIAACLAEHGVREPVIGVAFDGAGLGTDGAIWGGEFLLVDGARFTRCGHLANVALPGGDAAARRPWRSAAAHLVRLHPHATRWTTLCPPSVAASDWELAGRLLARPGMAVQTSSIGRLFDAVSSLLGLVQTTTFEGQGAMMLEGLAGARVVAPYGVTIDGDDAWTADPATIIEAVLADLTRGRNRAEIAAAFHSTLRKLIVLGCERIREGSGVGTVALGGGVFANARLTSEVHTALVEHRFQVLIPREVPCNDGGLALGQAYVAARALEEEDVCA